MRIWFLRMSCSAALLAMAGVTVARADQRVPRNQVPSAVRDTAQQEANGATIHDYTTDVENGQREYEAEMEQNGMTKDVTIAPDGRLLEVEQQVSLDSLPSQVKSSLQQKAGNGHITKIESIRQHGKVVAYEAQVTSQGKHSEIQVGPHGGTVHNVD